VDVPSPNPNRGYPIALAGTALLATTAVFIRHLTEQYALPPLVLAFWRDLFVLVTLLPFLAWRRRGRLLPPRRDLLFLVLFGAILAGFNLCWTLSVAINGAAVATVLV